MHRTLRKSPKLPDEIKMISDDHGNLVQIKDNGKRLILSLKLATHTKTRRLGVVNLQRKIFEVRRNRDKHLFRKNQSYGFNHKLLSEAKKFDKVRLIDDECEWLIPVEFILKNGKFLNFINSGGFELQIFIELSRIEEFKRKKRI